MTDSAPPAIPPLENWPPHLRRFLVAQLLERYFAPLGGESVEAWCQLLRATYQARLVEVDGKRFLIPWAQQATPKLYAHACREAEEWEKAQHVITGE